MAGKQRRSAKGRGFGGGRAAGKGMHTGAWRKNVPGFHANRRSFVGGFRLCERTVENDFRAA